MSHTRISTTLTRADCTAALNRNLSRASGGASLREAPSSSSVPLTREQIDGGWDFGGLLKALREERGWTLEDLVVRVEGLIVKGTVRSVDLHGVIGSAERAAACTLSPWMASIVAWAMTAAPGGKALTQRQHDAWRRMAPEPADQLRVSRGG